MEKRRTIIGTYNTARHWTLSQFDLGETVQQTNFVEVPGGIPLDMSTTLTDGEPSYSSRKLTVRLECSEGTRADRERWIAEMVNGLDGYRLDIVPPDRPAYYLTGRVHVKKDYNDPAHASVTVTATCDPWLYNATERAYQLTAATSKRTQVLTNGGRRSVVPQLVVTGSSILLEWGTMSQALGAGTYLLPALWLRPGDTLLTYSGSGTVKITYREAVLQ